MAEKLGNVECHCLQNDFYLKNILNEILSCSALNSTFVVNVAILLFKSALFMSPAIVDLSTNPSFFILLTITSLVSLL